MVFGASSSAFGYRNVAVGFGNLASADYSAAFGYHAQAPNIGGVAIGYETVADRDFAISDGQADGERQIIHLADGTHDTDPVTFGS